VITHNRRIECDEPSSGWSVQRIIGLGHVLTISRKLAAMIFSTKLAGFAILLAARRS
jgi:hypothetical protein